MTDSNDTKGVVERFFATFSTGDVDRIMDGLSDDASWWVSLYSLTRRTLSPATSIRK